MLDRENFQNLETALENVSRREDGGLKAGLKLSLAYLIKRCVKVMKAHHIIDGLFQKSTELDWFSAVVALKWDYLFST